ncbi:hypothetical protein CHLRE_03g190400v5 [Chlamydomonas reinhardtii]|uniref:Uncharacterized protein n=1 Tax=Chlamydomonas reinhardtii TaxID=3055 RepID=A0A2K3DYB1_CHLRE|nr:uncharacterized protein CHLRE_03g190400v5 [Chlamydomonas reinhardtii]PNW85521.1 hypothetical protein CHLRE_03g190400v5 [Chlamydomonas reinhardtii]
MCSVLGGFGADLKQLDDSAVDALWKAGYRSEDLLQIATHKGLKDAGLLPAYVDYVLSLKASAAGLGVGSAPGADGRHLAWVAVPLMVLALVVDRGVSTLDDIKQCAKLFIARNDVALATAYHGVRGVGVVASVGLGVVAAVRACVKRLKVQPGRPRVSRLKRPKQQLDLAPAGVLPAARTSTTGQVNASQDG